MEIRELRWPGHIDPMKEELSQKNVLASTLRKKKRREEDETYVYINGKHM
jgi:hypothetical protein